MEYGCWLRAVAMLRMAVDASGENNGNYILNSHFNENLHEYWKN